MKNWLKTPVHNLTTNEKMIKLGIVPKYTEITLYLISVTFIMFLLTSSEFRAEAFDFFEDVAAAVFWGAIVLSGLIVSIYGAFTKRILGRKEKNLILLAVIFLNFFVAVHAGKYVLKETQNWLIIFPVLNILNAIFWLFLFRLGAITEKSISDKQAKKEEIVLGTLFVILIFLISHHVFNHYWAITFSVCLVYVTSLVDLSDRIIIKSLFRKDKKDTESSVPIPRKTHQKELFG